MDCQVSAVLLAAGSSLRMGQWKQLLPIQNRPAVRFCAETVASSGIGDIVVVLNPKMPEISGVLDKLVTRIVCNEKAETEMADSVRTGIRAIDPASSGVLICLCDHPLISPETIRNLVHLHGETPGMIIIPLYKGRRGHPTLFPASVLGEILEGLTLRDILQKDAERIRLVEVSDEGVELDMDTMEDYEKISQRAGL